jgi:hypothetical protein
MMMTAENLLKHTARAANIEQMLKVMDEIEYRRAVSEEDMQSIAELRRSAYEDAEIYDNGSMSYIDDYDYDPRVFVFGVYWRERLVATLRIHILSRENLHSHSQYYFSSVLDSLISQGATFMDPSRFAVLPDLEREIPGLATVVLRLGLAAVRHFNCDFGLAMIREGHGGFYRRLFNYTQMTPPQTFPGIKRKYALFSTSRSHLDAVCFNYPVLDGLPIEAKLLFSTATPAKPRVLSVRPTARLAIRKQTVYPDLLQAAQ